uniref:DSHCT domain-containing protein n=1 Tax=Macrostomum lignano TaxID=282301 RepID=A0A1I8FB47_9PLAT
QRRSIEERRRVKALLKSCRDARAEAGPSVRERLPSQNELERGGPAEGAGEQRAARDRECLRTFASRWQQEDAFHLKPGAGQIGHRIAEWSRPKAFDLLGRAALTEGGLYGTAETFWELRKLCLVQHALDKQSARAASSRTAALGKSRRQLDRLEDSVSARICAAGPWHRSGLLGGVLKS